MPPLPPPLLLFVTVNAVFGAVIGTITARVPAFEDLIPTFLWLVAGLFVIETSAALVLKTHPSALIPMPWRVAALVVSFVFCYAALALMK
jgi:hypothetical protein